MMKSDDKERVLPDDMIPTTKVYTTKVLKAAKKPWCASGLALCIAGVSIIMSISILIASMYWFGLVPDEIVKGDDQKWIKKIFGEVDDHEKRLTDLEIGQICELPMDSGECYDIQAKWYFDKAKGRCIQFSYSGCMGNANNFKTEVECQVACKVWGDEMLYPPNRDKIIADDPCTQSPDSGRCRAIIPRYYYDQDAGQCKKFDYGGCAGNTNNFHTEQDCLNKCQGASTNQRIMSPSADICEMKPETGSCRANIERWHFDSELGSCQTFTYGGCDGNENNFASKEKCESICHTTDHDASRGNDQDICFMPSDTGPCRAAVTRFYFNTNSAKCEMFLYGGCSGNANNFETPQDCMEKCNKNPLIL